jgi:hypothetical protein
MAKYLVTSKVQLNFSLKPEGDFMCVPGSEVQLPETNPHVCTLERMGFLQRIVEKPVEKEVEKKSSKTVITKTEKQ